jgi:hypothetical protein
MRSGCCERPLGRRSAENYRALFLELFSCLPSHPPAGCSECVLKRIELEDHQLATSAIELI